MINPIGIPATGIGTDGPFSATVPAAPTVPLKKKGRAGLHFGTVLPVFSLSASGDVRPVGAAVNYIEAARGQPEEHA